MSFKDISYLELWQPFCSVKMNHFCNFGKGHYENNSVNDFEFGSVVQEEMSLKDISYLELFGSRTFCAILVEGINSNNYVKYFLI